MDSYGLSMNALFGFKKEVEKNEMVDCCRRGACVPALIWTVLLYCGRGKRGQAVRETGAERQDGWRRRKRIEETMRRISQRTAPTVISGTAGNRNAERNAAIIFCRRKDGIVPVGKAGAVEIAASVLMGGIPPVSATACRKSLRKCGCTVKHSEERR